jgi:hypothetical protein
MTQHDVALNRAEILRVVNTGGAVAAAGAAGGGGTCWSSAVTTMAPKRAR